MKLKCGYPIEKWNDAKRQVRAVLIERAKAHDNIPYVELTRNSSTPQSFALTIMLREIAAEENAPGRGMLTAMVVYSSGDMQPGPGFFALAGRLGKNTNDILRCWIKELKRVYASLLLGRMPGEGKRPIDAKLNNHEFPCIMTVG
jgi:hypothetical protein